VTGVCCSASSKSLVSMVRSFQSMSLAAELRVFVFGVEKSSVTEAELNRLRLKQSGNRKQARER
jgi:hypothetical protein